MDLYIVFISLGILVGLIVILLKNRSNPISEYRKPERELPYQWRNILQEKVPFYKRLNREEKDLFEYKVHIFLLNVRIIGMQTDVSHEDRVLIASSAIIPIFRFKHWHYMGLKEVHLFPDKFDIPNSENMAKGLVGWGEMQGKMMLSKKALHHGYADPKDNKNVAIHEFVHLLDKSDGEVDGVLENIMKEVDISPWLHLMHTKMNEIHDDRSDIRDYAGVNQGEFLAAVSEYFFENPDRMQVEHPALYNALDSFFNPKITDKYKYTAKYDRCPCGSGKRYGQCCMKNSVSY